MANPSIASPSTFLSNHPGQIRPNAQRRDALQLYNLKRSHADHVYTEHVLRSCSNSSDPFPFRSRQRSSSIITNPYDGYEIPPADKFVPFKAQPNGQALQPVKISPTPSMKRGKAERLLKEHGSPPGVRVTAGGRIVPDGLTPITSPRAQQRQGFGSQQLAHISIPRVDLRNLPSASYLQSVEGYLVLGEGQIFQVHNGHLVPVGRVGNPALNLVCPPANQTLAPGAQYGAGVDYHIPLHQMTSSFYPPNPEHEAIDEHTLSKLDECHGKFQEELRELDRNEVLQRDSLTVGGKREIVRRRIELVNRIDETRRSILRARKVLKDRAAAATVTSPPLNTPSVSSMTAGPQPAAAAAPMPQQYISTPAPMAYGFAPSYPFIGSEFPHYAMMAPSMPHQTFAYGVQPMTPSLPTGAELVPFHAQHDYPLAANLQSRAGNAGLGISNSFGPTEDSHGSSKPQDVSVGPKSINLDGSGHQPRRSHAVTIKAPEPGSKEKKMLLNPNSQSYQPQNANHDKAQEDAATRHTGHARSSSFMPSAAMVAGVDRLVGSPQRAQASLDKSDSTSKYGASSSTASTSDFFPQDTDNYSATKHAYNDHNQNSNLGGWMIEEDVAGPQSTPKRSMSKQMWNTSPGEHFFDALPDHDGRPQTAFAAAASPVRMSQRTEASSLPEEKNLGGNGSFDAYLSPGRMHGLDIGGKGHSPEATVISGDGLGLFMAGSRGARSQSMHRSDSGTGINMSPSRRLYRLGLEDGLGNKLDRVHNEFEYLQGLREGLQQRTRQAEDDSGPTAARVPSFTSPTVPVNSPLSTPRSASSFDGKFSPATALAFSSQPNVKVVDMQRGIGTQTSTARLRGSDQHTSPLTDRQRSPFLDASRHMSPAETFSARMYRLQLQDKQRGAGATETTQKHVQVVFPQQDGPPEKIEANMQQLQQLQSRRATHQDIRAAPPPAMVAQQSGGSSPGKRLSSAAATMLAFGRKLKSPEPVTAEGPKSPGSSKSCSPSKSRPGWRRRIEDKIIPASTSLSPPK